MVSPGPLELKVMLVSVGEPAADDDFTRGLVAELERRRMGVLRTTVADAEQDIEQEEPHLVVLCGTRGAAVISTLLDDGLQGTRPRLVVTAPRAELAKLQGLNRNVVAGLLASDLGERLVVERLQSLARQAAQLRQGGWKKASSAGLGAVPASGSLAPRASANPTAPEFFAGMDSRRMLDPLFPSLKPAAVAAATEEALAEPPAGPSSGKPAEAAPPAKEPSSPALAATAPAGPEVPASSSKAKEPSAGVSVAAAARATSSKGTRRGATGSSGRASSPSGRASSSSSSSKAKGASPKAKGTSPLGAPSASTTGLSSKAPSAKAPSATEPAGTEPAGTEPAAKAPSPSTSKVLSSKKPSSSRLVAAAPPSAEVPSSSRLVAAAPPSAEVPSSSRLVAAASPSAEVPSAADGAPPSSGTPSPPPPDSLTEVSVVDFELEPADFDVKTERSVPPPLPEGFGKPPAEPPASDAGELDAPFSVEDVTTVDSRPAASLSPDSIPAAAIESVPAESIPAAAIESVPAESIPAAAIESIPADSIPPTSAVAGAAVAATASGSPVSPTAAIGQPTALGDSVPADWTDSAPSVTNVDDIAASARSSRPPGRRKGKLLGAALALGAAAGGIYWALPLIAPGERAQVQGAAPDAASEVDDAAAADTASNTAADGAAADGTAADGTAALPGDASSGSDGASSAAQGAPTDPLLVKEADVKGCDALLEGFEQQMVDPVQEASLAWKDAREAIVKGTLAVAERKMCEAVQLHGESAALEGLAMLYLTERAPKRALGYLERAEAARPETMELINLRGDILSQLGDADGALAAWLRALKLEPDEAGRRRAAAREFDKQGQGHLRRGAVPQAERWFRRAAALDPTNILALNGLAEVFLQTERLPQAETMARRALEISEYNPQAHVVLGDVARQAGDLVAARGSYERALQVRSDHWSAKARLRELAKEE